MEVVKKALGAGPDGDDGTEVLSLRGFTERFHIDLKQRERDDGAAETGGSSEKLCWCQVYFYSQWWKELLRSVA